MKNLLLTLLAFLLLCTAVQAATYSGNCGKNGNNLTWTLNTDTRRLTISGTGAMADYTATSPSPWSTDSYRNNVMLVDIANTVTSLGHYAFSNCEVLYRIVLPRNITKVDSAFYNCTRLGIIYTEWDTEAAIPEWNGMLCGNISSNKSVYIPCGTTDIYKAKAGWTGLSRQEILVHGECGPGRGAVLDWRIECDGDLVIMSSGGTSSGYMPDYTPGSAPWYPYRDRITRIGHTLFVNGIGQYAFYGCYNAKEASLNDANDATGRIPEGAFDGCAALEQMSISGRIGTIERYAFRNCTSLRRLFLTSIVTIQDSAFIGCTALRDLNVPFAQTIGAYAFGGCTALRSASFGTAGLTSIGQRMLKDCPALTDITVSWTGDIPAWPAQMTTANGITLHVPCSTTELYAAANGWKNYAIVENAMGYCGDSTDIRWTLDCDGHMRITGQGPMVPSYSEINIVPWYTKRNEIRSVTIGDSVTYVSSSAFRDNTGLQLVTIGRSVRKTGIFAFRGCTHLLSATLPEKMDRLGDQAFYECSLLQSVTMPDSLGALGNSVFYNCAQLRSIRVPEGVKTIDYRTFYGCRRLDTISLPSTLNSIGNSAFSGCGALTSISIPPSVTQMGDNDIFTNCTALRDIYTYWTERAATTSSSVYTGSAMSAANIRVHVLCGTRDLYTNAWKTKFTIVGGPFSGLCSAEGDSAAWFLDCDSVLTIGGHGRMVFEGGTAPWAEHGDSVRTIVIGDSITQLADSAFAACRFVQHIYASWTENIPACPTELTAEPKRRIRLHVPCNAVSDYRAAAGWQDYRVTGEGTNTVIFINRETGDTLSVQTVDCEQRATPPEADEGYKWLWESSAYESVTCDLVIYGRLADATEKIGATESGKRKTESRKILRDGQLLIERGGKTYNAFGIEVR